MKQRSIVKKFELSADDKIVCEHCKLLNDVILFEKEILNFPKFDSYISSINCA
jgi:hypothetical protein